MKHKPKPKENIIPLPPSLNKPKLADNIIIKPDDVKPSPVIKPPVKVFNLGSMVDRRKLINELKIKFQIG